MAFSTNQINYINSFLATMISDSSDIYYVAYTDSSTSTGEPDLYIAVSDSPIRTSNGYTYSFSAGSYTLYSIITGNYGSYQSYNTQRVNVSGRSSSTLTIDVYEHISTNAEFINAVVLQPDIFGSNGGYYYEKTNTQLTSLSFFLAALLLLDILFCFFRRR